MWSTTPDLFDAHVHADSLSDGDLETLARLGVAGVLMCAHDGAPERRHDVTVDAWLRHFDDLLSVHAKRVRKSGLRPLLALGIHAAHAPWHGFERLLHRLPEYFSEPSVVAVGAIGSRTLDLRERHVLTRQAELASDLRLPLIVGMPPTGGDAESRTMLRVLRELPLDPERILVEGAPPSAIRPARAFGFNVSLDTSGGRLSMDEVSHLVRQQGPNGFVFASHAGHGSADLLGVPGMVARLGDAGLSRAVIQRVGRGNALRFLGRPDAELRVRAVV